MTPATADDPGARVVGELWGAFERRNWDGARALLADDLVIEWPQTGERFRGADAFLAMNRAHPAPNWHISVRRLLGQQDQVAAEVLVRTDDGADVCLGFYEVRDGLVRAGVEYWTEHGNAPTPAWRAAWTERLKPPYGESPAP